MFSELCLEEGREVGIRNLVLEGVQFTPNFRGRTYEIFLSDQILRWSITYVRSFCISSGEESMVSGVSRGKLYGTIKEISPISRLYTSYERVSVEARGLEVETNYYEP